MRRVVLSLVATFTLAGAAALAAPALAGDGYGYGHDRGYVERDYAFYGYSGDGAVTRVRRDGNVFYRAYNSWDGYYRHRGLGYWERPSDRYYGYGYGWGYYGGRYANRWANNWNCGCEGYGYRGRHYGYGRGYYGEGGAYYTPGYGWYDPNGRGYSRGGYGDDDGDGDED